MLALIAKLNCKPLPTGRLVTTEEKEQLLKERTQSTPKNEAVESTSTIVEDEMETNSANGAINGTLPAFDATDLTAAVSSDNDSDSELLLTEHVQYRQPDLWPHVKVAVKSKLQQYYHWMELLFRNGWWRTTLLLWYMWYVLMCSTHSTASLTAVYIHNPNSYISIHCRNQWSCTAIFYLCSCYLCPCAFFTTLLSVH